MSRGGGVSIGDRYADPVALAPQEPVCGRPWFVIVRAVRLAAAAWEADTLPAELLPLGAVRVQPPTIRAATQRLSVTQDWRYRSAPG